MYDNEEDEDDETADQRLFDLVDTLIAEVQKMASGDEDEGVPSLVSALLSIAHHLGRIADTLEEKNA